MHIALGSLELDKQIKLQTNRIIVHQFNSSVRLNDIALIQVVRLREHINMTTRLRILDVPSDSVRVVGWGYTNFTAESVANSLQEATMHRMDTGSCRQMLVEHNNATSIQISDQSNFCLAGTRTTGCYVKSTLEVTVFLIHSF